MNNPYEIGVIREGSMTVVQAQEFVFVRGSNDFLALLGVYDVHFAPPDDNF